MKLKKGLRLYFADNENNRGVLGVFINSPYVYYQDHAYTCSITFQGNIMRIHDLIRTKPGTDRIVEHLFKLKDADLFFEKRVSRFKRNLIQYKMNLHPLSFKKFQVKKNAYNRKRTIQAFGVALVGSLIYLFINLTYNDWLKSLIANNIYIQTFLIFMSLISVMRLWRPFSIKKGISEKDVKRIVNETIETKERNKEIEEQFGSF